MVNAISVTDLSIRHPLAPTNALDGISLELEQGKIYGLIGPNGSGQTTLCNTLRGLIPSILGGTVTGSIRILGEDLTELDDRQLAASIGLVFENPYTQLTGVCTTVVEEIAFGLENLGWDRDRMIDRVAQTIVDTHLQSLAFKDPLELSGGQRQRVSLAAVLAMDTPILLIDEPTSQLDPLTTDMILEVIYSLKNTGKTVLLAENKVDLLVDIVDEFIIVDQGRTYAQGSAQQVLPKALEDGVRCGFPEVLRLSAEVGRSPWLTREDAWADISTSTRVTGLGAHHD